MASRFDGTAVIPSARRKRGRQHTRGERYNVRPFLSLFMRILWITPGFAADEADTACIPPLQLLARELLTQGVDLQIVALEYPFRKGAYYWSGAQVFPCDGRNRRWLKGRTLWRAWRRCRQIIQGSEVTAIHSFWLGWSSVIGEKLSWQYRIPHFTTLMGQDVLPGNGLFLRRLSGERSNRLVALSAFQNEIFEQNAGFGAGHVIPWGIPAREIQTGMSSARPIDVLGVGSLVAVKNWDMWLETIAAVHTSMPGLRAMLIGDGPEKSRLMRYAGRMGLESTVEWAGGLSREEVLLRMRQARVLLHTARFESYGFVLAEAAANGCRIVSTPVGIAADPGVTASEAPRLAELLINALGRPVQNEPAQPYSVNETASAYLHLYAGR
ncbi:MAG: glycosyltransferase [Saprospiraceae bacterium]|nr:glycosyltransferase [Saprospiraceae bacterium]